MKTFYTNAKIFRNGRFEPGLIAVEGGRIAAAGDALNDAEKAGLVVNRELVREVSKYVNLLAGTYLLDTLSKEEIYQKIQNKLGL